MYFYPLFMRRSRKSVDETLNSTYNGIITSERSIILENAEQQKFFAQKRNLACLIVWIVTMLGLIGGVIMNVVLYKNGSLAWEDFVHRTSYSLISLVGLPAVYLVEWIFRIRFPLFLELSVNIFVFAASTLATVYNFYDLFEVWDKVLHTGSGFLFAAVGLSLSHLVFADKLSGWRKVLAFCLLAFLISLAVGYVWEIYEFTADTITGSDLQPWDVSIVEDLGNGTYIVNDKRGEGLIDTMLDMTVNLIGAVVMLIPVIIISAKKKNVLDYFKIEILPRRKKKAQETEQK